MIMGILSNPCMDVDFPRNHHNFLHLAGAGSLWYAPPELNPPVEVEQGGERTGLRTPRPAGRCGCFQK